MQSSIDAMAYILLNQQRFKDLQPPPIVVIDSGVFKGRRARHLPQAPPFGPLEVLRA